jgi:hypothetical protein
LSFHPFISSRLNPSFPKVLISADPLLIHPRCSSSTSDMTSVMQLFRPPPPSSFGTTFSSTASVGSIVRGRRVHFGDRMLLFRLLLLLFFFATRQLVVLNMAKTEKTDCKNFHHHRRRPTKPSNVTTNRFIVETKPAILPLLLPDNQKTLLPRRRRVFASCYRNT